MSETISLSSHPQLSDRVYEVIKEWILDARLAPGQQLPVVELARQLGVSRTPVKDAFKRLSAEGFVVELPRRGYSVARLDAQDIRDLLDARLVLEFVAAERGVSSARSEQLEEMRQALRAMEQCLDDQGQYVDYAGFVNADYEFHMSLMSLSNNRRLAEIYRSVYRHLQAVRVRLARDLRSHRTRNIIQGHTAVADHLESGDLPALREALIRHSEGARQRYITGDTASESN